MKITKRRLRRIIKEAYNPEVMDTPSNTHAKSFHERKVQVVRIHDGFVDFLEAEEKFPIGEIPRSVMDALMKAALITVDAMEAGAQK